MFAAASSQLGPHWSEAKGEVCDACGALEAGQHVEIQALDEERAQMAAQILQARHDQVRKPVKAVGQKFVCQDSASESSDRGLIPKEGVRASCFRMLSQRLPVIAWLGQLSCSVVRADVIAGVTVAIMAVPQSMSYAKIAGLPYVFGMYSACVPTIVYAFFGQSRQLAVGPVAMVSLLVEAGLRGQLSEEQCPVWYEVGVADEGKQQYDLCPEAYTRLAMLTALVVGAIQILACLLRLGFIVSFLGHPVISGFTSGAAIIIGLSQVKYLLGFDIAKSEFVYETVWNIAVDIQQTQPMTLFLGLLWLACLFTNKKIAAKYKRLSILGALGPLISCVIGIALIWLCAPLRDEFSIAYVGEITKGLPPLSINEWEFGDLSRVMPTAITAALVGYMESIAISKNLAAKHGYEVEPGQELLALGMSNVVGSMFSCYPVTGSFSRSAVNNATGALSQLSGLVTGVVMFCVLMALTPLFFYLPKYVLAAIVINSVIALIAYDEAFRLWRVKRSDFALWIVAFLGTLFLGVTLGIAIAVALSLCIVIYESVRPQITILWRIPGTTIYRNVKQESSGSFVPNVFIARIGSSMYFANASFIKDMLLTYIEDLAEVNRTEYIVLEMTPVVSVDSAAIHCIQDIVHYFRKQGVQVAFAMVGNRVEKVMQKADLISFVGKEWFFPTVNGAVHYCLQHQQAKKASAPSAGQQSAAGSADHQVEALTARAVHPGNEVGISNDLNHQCTAVFVSLLRGESSPQRPLVGDVLSAFQGLEILVAKTQVDVTDDFAENHFYLVKDAVSKEKLCDSKIESLRKVLSPLLAHSAHDAIEPQALQSEPVTTAGGEEEPSLRNQVVHV